MEVRIQVCTAACGARSVQAEPTHKSRIQTSLETPKTSNYHERRKEEHRDKGREIDREAWTEDLRQWEPGRAEVMTRAKDNRELCVVKNHDHVPLIIRKLENMGILNEPAPVREWSDQKLSCYRTLAKARRDMLQHEVVTTAQ